LKTCSHWALELRGGTGSGGTVMVYLRSARQFLGWLSERHPGIDKPGDIDRRVVLGWFQHRTEEGKSEATRKDGIALRLFLGYVAGEPDSGLDANPAAGLDLPTVKVKPVPVIADADLSKLLKSMSGNSFIDRRDTVIVRMLLDTGCRRAELVGINVSHIDLRHQEVKVLGKGSKERIVPFGGKTALAIRKYLRVRECRAAGTSDALLLSVRPSDRGTWRMTGGGIGEMLTRRAKLAGLDHVYPHQFRHSWAHDLLANGANESDVERLAGWSTPLMVRRYGSSLADQRARESSRKLARGDRV
jgi:site-specific recombinase XerD